MTKAIMCDRCGVVVGGEVSPMRMQTAENVDTNPLRALAVFYNDTYDLCEECAASFNDWFVAGQEVE